MDISIEEFSALSEGRAKDYARITELEMESKMLKQQLERLENEVAQKQMEIAQRQGEIEALKMRLNEVEFHNSFLRQYIFLSVEKVKEFAQHLKKLEQWAFLRSFVSWALPDEHHKQQMERLEEALSLPTAEEPRPIIIEQAQDVIAEGGVKNVENKFDD
jgi:uncharacterized coiled-coil protein SlyX